MIPEHYLRYDEFKEMIPVLAFDPDLHVFQLEDQALAFGCISSPLAGSDEKAGERLNQLLNLNWPKNAMLQWLNFNSPDITARIEQFSALRVRSVQERRQKRATQNLSPEDRKSMEDQDEVILGLTAKQSDFWMKGANKPIIDRPAIRINNAYCVVTVRIPISGSKPTLEEWEQAGRYCQQVKSTLESVQLNPTLLTPETWLRVMQVILNRDPNSHWRTSSHTQWDREAPLRDQCLDPGTVFEVKRDGIVINDKDKIKFLCVKKLPESCYWGMAREYLCDFATGSRGIRENALIWATVYFGDAEAERTKIETQRSWVTHQAFGPMLKFVPRLAQQKASFDEMQRLIDKGDRTIRFYFGIGIYTTPEDEAPAVANAIAYFRERGFQMLEDRMVTLPAFMQALPMCADPRAVPNIMRFRRMATAHATNFLPAFGDWSGTGSPSLTFIARSGQLMSMSLFDSPTSYNGLITAESGAGKSVTCNFIAMNTLGAGGRVWIIDVGRSYQKTCRAVGGQFISFERGSRICLNPFNLVKDYREEADILLGLVLAMAFNTQKPSDYQTSAVRKCLTDLWGKHGTKLTVDYISEALLADTDDRVSDIGSQLFAFTSAGEYGEYFNGENNVSFNNNMVVVELEELKSRAHLQKVVLLQLIYQIQQECYLGIRDQQKVCIVDEGWSLLTEGEVGVFIEGAFRRFRKYGAACLVATQSIDDLYKSPNGEAIVANAPNMFLLRQKAEVIDRARENKRLSLPEGCYDWLKSVHTIPEVYSEIMFVNPYGIGVGRLILDPYSNVLYSTKAAVAQRVEDLVKQGFSQDQAIRSVLGDNEALTSRYDQAA